MGEAILSTLDLTVTDFWMILVVTVVFAIFSSILGKLCFQPFLRLYEERERLTEGAVDSADEQRQEAARLTSEYEESIQQGRMKGMQERLEKLGEARLEAARKVSEAEQKAASILSEGRSRNAEALGRVRSELNTHTRELAEELANRLLKAS